MPASPRVSLLMPVHNRAHLLDGVLDKLAANTTYENVELIAVDDRSTDGSMPLLRRWEASGRMPGMRVLEGSGRGAIDALNAALNAATGDLCIQLDDDVTVETPGWIERMLDLMLFDDAIGVVTGKVVFDAGEIHTCGVNVIGPSGWHDRSSEPGEPIGRRLWINRTRRRPLEGEAGEIETRVAEVDSGIGACMMYRRENALAVGGYDDEWSPVWFDDLDLCLKIRARLGKKVFYTPHVRVIHHLAHRRPDPSWRAKLRPPRLRRGILRRVAKLLPGGATRAVERRIDIDLLGYYTKEQCALLRHHHGYWRSKWGWDALNPDMDAIERRWGDTELWWRYDDERRAAGERIAAAYEARDPNPAVG